MLIKRRWDVLLLLPNLVLPKKTRFATDSYSICRLDDWRAKRCLRPVASNPRAKRIARRYRTVWNKHYVPSVLLGRRRNDEKYPVDDLRNFRNMSAIASVVYANARLLTGSQWLAQWSDSFTFGRFTAGETGIVSLDGSSTGWWDEDDLVKFRGTSAEVVDTPEHFSVQFDRVLFGRLCDVFSTPERMELVERERLFRSLAMAFHAARYPSDGLTVGYDLGVRYALWVSAFEALLNPQDRDIKMPEILRFLERVPWHREDVAATRYWEFNRAGRRVGRTNLAGAIYQRLYKARNLYLHGSPVPERIGVVRRRSLLRLVPVIYGITLHEYLRTASLPVDDLVDYFWGQGALEEALSACRTIDLE